MVISVKGHPVNLDTFNASPCFHEIQKLQEIGGVMNSFRASAMAVELPWHSLRDAFAHGCELFTGVPQAYRDGQLTKHSWHFVRAVSSATYAAVALPLALTPGLSLKVADSLYLRDSWENKVSKGVIARVKDTVVGMSKGRKTRSVLKIGVGLAAFGALAWLTGNFNTPTVMVQNVVKLSVPLPTPNIFAENSIPNLGDYNFKPLLEVTSQASNLDPKSALGTAGAVVGGAIILGFLGKYLCGGSKKTKPAKLEEPLPERVDEPKADDVDPIVDDEPELVQTKRTVKIGKQRYPILSNGTVIAKRDEIFDVSAPSEKYLSISINGKMTPIVNHALNPWQAEDGDAWYSDGVAAGGERNWKQLSGTPDELFAYVHVFGKDMRNSVLLDKSVTINGEHLEVRSVGGKLYACNAWLQASYEVTYATDIHWITIGKEPCPVLKSSDNQWYCDTPSGRLEVHPDDQGHFRVLTSRNQVWA